MRTRTVAVVVFYDTENNILLQDRRDFSTHAPWGLFGGSLDGDETPEQALVREIEEELCYKLEKYEHLGVFEGDYPGLHVVSHLFIAPLPAAGISVFTQTEGQGMKLCSIPEARKLLVYGDQPGILDALEKKLL